jgi:siderophore synthetase component
MLQEQQTLASTAERSMMLAERAAERGLLNSYLREAGIYKPIVWQKDADQFLRTQPQTEIFVITLPLTGKTIAGELMYVSAIGQHEYGPNLYEVQEGNYFVQMETRRLIEVLLDEVSQMEKEAARESRRREMNEQIENSVRKMSFYIQNYLENEALSPTAQLDYIRSEQSLLLGHPFHPTPKSSEGFADEETVMYSPEIGAAFALHYFAVSTEIVKEEWIAGYGEVIAESVRLAMERRLGDAAKLFKLIPLHPWQVQYVLAQEIVRELIEQGKLIDLGPLGPTVYPTSSVRTVWYPEAGYFYKLPLHVRITNFIRENTPEQIIRTMDAARVLHHISGELDQEKFRILLETGYRTVCVNGAVPSQREQIMASFAVVYREAEAIGGTEQSHCFVMASLLEHFPEESEPKLMQAIRQTNQGRLPDLFVWLKAYLHMSMLPLLQLFAGKGISLEAHLQNSLVSIEQGMPSRCYVRDLEGVSIDREKAFESGWLQTLISDNSPVLYTEDAAWLRLKYYFFINHLGALIHTLARYSQTEEERFWRVVRSVLEEEKAGTASKRLNKYVTNLLEGASLPAKANFISRFQGRGETPLYVDIPNPMNRCEVEQ